TVDGADGEQVNTLNSANIPAHGGRGGAGGGDGGNGSPNSFARSATGGPGFGPGQLAAGGGAGGLLSCLPALQRGSGGGGGSFATQRAPLSLAPAMAGTAFQQRQGIGGQGGQGGAGVYYRSLAGGAAGISPFTALLTENNFFGLAFDVHRGRNIVGELPLP